LRALLTAYGYEHGAAPAAELLRSCCATRTGRACCTSRADRRRTSEVRPLAVAELRPLLATERGVLVEPSIVLESASAEEIQRRLHDEVFVTRVEVRLPGLRRLSEREVCMISSATVSWPFDSAAATL